MTIWIAFRDLHYGLSYANRVVIGIFNNKLSANKCILLDKKNLNTEEARKAEVLLGVSVEWSISQYEVQD
jgi:hypothetical protein